MGAGHWAEPLSPSPGPPGPTTSSPPPTTSSNPLSWAAPDLDSPRPTYFVGPAIPFIDGQGAGDVAHLRWLDSLPGASVLCVSLGSFLSVSKAQMEESVAGVRDSGVRLLWVARGETSRIGSACAEDSGLVAPWCEQLKVLCHPSVGGFWTSCGWNSTLEAIYADGGVPMLTCPIFMDQVPNSKQIVEDWKIGSCFERK